MIKNLVLSGGGLGGVSFIGALEHLQENKLLNNVNKYSGTSIGGIICTLLCFLDIKDIKQAVLENTLLRSSDLDIFGLNINFGINNGEHLFNILSKYIHVVFEKIPTLLELHEYSKKDLFLTTTNLSQYKTIYLNFRTHPDLSILLAMQMTMCIPLYFHKVEYNGELYVDGGLLDNVPTCHFNNEKNETLVLFLKKSKYEPIIPESAIEYFLACLKCRIANYKINDEFERLEVLTSAHLLEHDYKQERIEELLREGYSSNINHLNTK